MVEIRYEDGFPKELKKEVSRLLKKWAPYFCTTVNRLFVRLENGEFEAGIDVRYKYRVANLYLAPGWLTFDADMRERIIIHELTHILTDPVSRWANGFLAKMTDQTLASVAEEWFIEGLEGMTEDISRAIYTAHTSRKLPFPAVKDAEE